VVFGTGMRKNANDSNRHRKLTSPPKLQTN
jgi:hypothetical protein